MDLMHDSLYLVIGERIRKRRSDFEMTQNDLAKYIGILRTSVANIESGRQRSPLHMLYKICEALKIEPTELIPTLEELSKSSNTSVVEGKKLPTKAAKILRQLIEID